MFLHIGEDIVILKKNILAILELNSIDSAITQEFIKHQIKNCRVKYISEEKHRSVVIASNEQYTLYYTPISVATLCKRSYDKNE